jgi:4-diphosphocytidyl-2-C-methyl-D-erythritol kinase
MFTWLDMNTTATYETGVSFAIHGNAPYIMLQRSSGIMPFAYAKINLGLFVLTKRADGYHDIATVLHRVNVRDGLTLAPSDAIEVLSDDPAAPGDPQNICFKAALALRELCGTNAGVRITLRKGIPVGAGLGGGSADAASVLRHLPSMWSCGVDDARLRTLALRLGSDVPFFLGKGSAVAHGRGEVLEYFPLDIPYTILLCNPMINVSTPWAYGQVHPRGPMTVDLRSLLLEGMRDPSLLDRYLQNDFEPAVFAEYPRIASLKKTMIDRGAAYASMSGSGSTVYGLFHDALAAKGVADLCTAGGFKVFLTPPHFNASC